MRKFAMLGVVVLVAALVACGPSKPTGADYLGKWNATRNIDGSLYKCPLDISKNGESFLITVEGENSGNSICKRYGGIFTLTPEGNLKGGPLGMALLSFDKEKNRVALNYGSDVQFLTKR
ncbi:MAG: hypothetical protein ABSD88_12800 [Candidatus Korobacteraceae bacterium]|jgi:hypothetical protein